MTTLRYALLSMQVLLQAQCDLLEKLSFEFQQLSIRDPLTNLRNRRGFFEAAVSEVAASQSQQSDLTALMIDIDHFKLTNDIHGHVVGDCVIRSVAEECQAALRQTDLLGRFGGEEFHCAAAQHFARNRLHDRRTAAGAGGKPGGVCERLPGFGDHQCGGVHPGGQ